MVLEKTHERPLDCREIKPVHPKGNQPWISIGRMDAEEVPILWPPDVKSWLTGKDPGAGKDWGQEEKGETENEMDGWHHQLNRHEFVIVKDREAWLAAIHSIAKSWTCLSNWRLTIVIPQCRYYCHLVDTDTSVSSILGNLIWTWIFFISKPILLTSGLRCLPFMDRASRSMEKYSSIGWCDLLT